MPALQERSSGENGIPPPFRLDAHLHDLLKKNPAQKIARDPDAFRVRFRIA